MKPRVKIIFYSLYGHVYRLAEAMAEGAREIPGAEVELLRVEETLPDEVIEKMGATEARKAFLHIPIANARTIAEADILLLGAGTRYGSVPAQMRAFLDQTGPIWSKGGLIGKVGGAFTSSSSQHGGQETTILNLHLFFLHMGMLVAGVPYAAGELLNMDEITGGTPYGASTVTGPTGARMPSDNELAIARFQGRNTTQWGARFLSK